MTPELKKQFKYLFVMRDAHRYYWFKYRKFCVNHAHEFDYDDWSLFAVSHYIIPDEMHDVGKYWARIYPYIKKLDMNTDLLSDTTKERLEKIVFVCEKLLNISPNPKF